MYEYKLVKTNVIFNKKFFFFKFLKTAISMYDDILSEQFFYYLYKVVHRGNNTHPLPTKRRNIHKSQTCIIQIDLN